jgi:serine protease
VNLPANCAGAIAVAGLRHAGSKNGFSSLGPEVAISAPGGNCPSTSPEDCQYPMLSTVNSGTTVALANGHRYSNSFDGEVGTSFSTPLVAATAALMFSANPALSVADMLTLMQDSARAFPTTGGGDPQDVPVPVACVAGRLVEQSECYCTTSTCGRGMLDAGRALRAVAALVTVPRFTTSADYATPGTTVALSAAGIQKPAANTITAYRWDITAGSDIASFLVGTTNAVTATGQNASLSTTAGKNGVVTVQLTVTDNTGDHSVSQNIVVGSVGTSTVSTPAPSSGGGGGAIAGLGGLAWLAGLALAVVALARTRRQRQAD